MALVLGAIAVFGVTTVATSSSRPEPSDVGHVGSSPAAGDVPETHPTGNEQPSDIAEAVPVLARPRIASDAVPDAIAQSPILTDGVADLSESRRVQRDGSDDAWIAPSSNRESVCLIAAGELNCPSVRDIETRGAAVATFWHATGPIRVTGIATEQVRSVEVLDADGVAAEVPVADGSFLYESTRAAREVRWVGPSGDETQVLPSIPGRE